MATDIRFGTGGWRSIIAKDFTFANVDRCSQELAGYLQAAGTWDQGLVVRYDTLPLPGVCRSGGRRGDGQRHQGLPVPKSRPYFRF